jgi:aspartate/methionine/tyrosine aminotransferase
MKLAPFALERYFAQHEFSARHLLSTSDCDGLMQQEVLALADAETRSLWDDLQLGYTESLGHPLLRAEIAKLYISISADNVLVVTPEEGIFIALQAMLNAGDHVICTYPGYQSLYSVAESLGCEVTKWLPHEEKGWHFDPAELAELVRPATKLLVVNFPHNPTGYLPTRENYAAIVNFARERNLYLFSDEMYRFLEHDPSQQLPSACDLYAKAVSLFGMSKSFGMAGVRLGWLATRDAALYAQCAAYKDFTTICSSAPSEILALIALRAKRRILADNLAKIQRNLAHIDRFMANHRDLISWVRPQAGTIGFARLHIDLPSDAFCEQVLRETGIMVVPSTLFGFGDRHIRLGFGRQKLPHVLDIFEEYLMRQFKRGSAHVA